MSGSVLHWLTNSLMFVLNQTSRVFVSATLWHQLSFCQSCLSSVVFVVSCLCYQLSLPSVIFAISCLCRQFSLSSVVYVTQFIARVVVVNRAKLFDAFGSVGIFQQGAGHWGTGNCLQQLVCCSTIASSISSSQHLRDKLHLKPTWPI